MSGHHHEGAGTGRTIMALGLVEPTDSCRAQGHAFAKTTLPRSGSDSSRASEVCLTCTESEGRLEGLRLWQSVCPCCFSSAFPQGLPTLEALRSRTSTGATRVGGSASSPTQGSLAREL